MMSNAPEKIYMQFGKDAVLSGSWCEKRIDAFNTEYIRSDIVEGMREALEAALEWLNEANISYANGNVCNGIDEGEHFGGMGHCATTKQLKDALEEGKDE